MCKGFLYQVVAGWLLMNHSGNLLTCLSRSRAFWVGLGLHAYRYGAMMLLKLCLSTRRMILCKTECGTERVLHGNVAMKRQKAHLQVEFGR